MFLRVFWLMFLIGCSSSYAGMFDDQEARKQIVAQQAVIGDVRDQAQAQEARIFKLEEALDNQPLLDLHSQIEALRLDLNKLQGQIEVLVNENELTQKRQKDFYIDLDHRLRRIEQPDDSAASAPAVSEAAVPENAVSENAVPGTVVSESAAEAVASGELESGAGPAAPIASVAPPAGSAPPAASPPVPPVPVENAENADSIAYENAYNLFTSGSYRDAISHFNKFLESYPGSKLAPSAHYWIGNSYYALRDFKDAISAQEELIKAYPNSAKTPDAMLNIASSQQEMNKKTAAKNTLESLIAKYPGSDAAEKAKQRLANIK